MRTYRIWDDSGESIEIAATDMSEAKVAAEEWVRGGLWDRSSTRWVTADIAEMDGGEKVARDYVECEIEPIEPRCASAGSHDWVDDGHPVGRGGGVWLQAHCSSCGMSRHTITGDSDSYGRICVTVRYEDECIE